MASSAKKRAARKSPATPRLKRYGEQALERLAWLMQHAESEQAQVAAAKELLERAGNPGTGPRGDAAGEKGLDDVVARLKALRGDG